MKKQSFIKNVLLAASLIIQMSCASKNIQNQPAEKVSSSVNRKNDRVVCKRNNEVRSIINIKAARTPAATEPQGARCKVAYRKFGKSEIVATALRDEEHCKKVIEGIRLNLEEAGFSCQDID